MLKNIPEHFLNMEMVDTLSSLIVASMQSDHWFERLFQLLISVSRILHHRVLRYVGIQLSNCFLSVRTFSVGSFGDVSRYIYVHGFSQKGMDSFPRFFKICTSKN